MNFLTKDVASLSMKENVYNAKHIVHRLKMVKIRNTQNYFSRQEEVGD